MYHVKEIPQPPPGGLDLNIADEEEFSPDKLRSNIERLYMTIVSPFNMSASSQALITIGYWSDGIWKAYCETAIVARDTSNCLVLHCLLCCLDV